jgi:REP element-mobilizing transposase RayT
MARPIRLQFAGAVYHVIGRGNARQPIVIDDYDRECFFSVLSSAISRQGWLCHAYCLMDNHYHLLIETPEPNLSMGMRHLAGVYTQTFNRRHHRVGHLFQGRYKSIVVDKDAYFAELARYIVLNPVRASIVSSPSEYSWSSYQATAGFSASQRLLTTDSLLQEFGKTKESAQKEYIRFIAANLDTKESDSLYTHIKRQCVLGSESFIQRISSHFSKESNFSEIPKHQRYANRPPLKELFPEGMTKASRNEAMHTAFTEYGYTQQEIAACIGLHYSWVSRIILKTTKSKT